MNWKQWPQPEISRIASAKVEEDFISFYKTICFAFSIYTFSRNHPDVAADAAIVLGAPVFGEDPSPALKERIDHAISLYRNQRVFKIIFTGGKTTEGPYPAEAIVAREYALGRSIKECDILIETESWTTEGNFYYAKKIADEHGLKSFVVVSLPFHMRRAMSIAQDHGLNAYPSPAEIRRRQSLRARLRDLFREARLLQNYLSLSTLRK